MEIIMEEVAAVSILPFRIYCGTNACPFIQLNSIDNDVFSQCDQASYFLFTGKR